MKTKVAEEEIQKEREMYHVLWTKYLNLEDLFQSLMQLATDYYEDSKTELEELKQKLREILEECKAQQLYFPNWLQKKFKEILGES